LFTRFKRDRLTLFLDPNSKESFSYEKGEVLDIVLSPSLYWVKKLKLPVKSVREVKKLLPSIFEDSLPQGHYSYYAYKSGEVYFLFAYEDKKIFDLLSAKGIAYADIGSVHFAQSEFKETSSAFCVNDKQCMYLKDELLVLAPSKWIHEKEKLDVKSLELSSHTVKLQQFGHIVDNGSLYKIGAILSILALILIVEIFIASAKKEEISLAKEEIFSKYNLQETMFQNRSALKKYTNIYETQKKFREKISYFLTMKLQKGQKITLIDYKNNLLSVTISGVTKETSGMITEQLDAKKVAYKRSFSADNMKLEIVI
jgi:hypothetical protein